MVFQILVGATLYAVPGFWASIWIILLNEWVKNVGSSEQTIHSAPAAPAHLIQTVTRIYYCEWIDLEVLLWI